MLCRGGGGALPITNPPSAPPSGHLFLFAVPSLPYMVRANAACSSPCTLPSPQTEEGASGPASDPLVGGMPPRMCVERPTLHLDLASAHSPSARCTPSGTPRSHQMVPLRGSSWSRGSGVSAQRLAVHAHRWPPADSLRAPAVTAVRHESQLHERLAFLCQCEAIAQGENALQAIQIARQLAYEVIVRTHGLCHRGQDPGLVESLRALDSLSRCCLSELEAVADQALDVCRMPAGVHPTASRSPCMPLSGLHSPNSPTASTATSHTASLAAPRLPSSACPSLGTGYGCCCH